MGLTCLCDFRSVSGWLTLCACVIFLLWEHALDKPQAVKMALLNFNLSLSEKWQQVRLEILQGWCHSCWCQTPVNLGEAAMYNCHTRLKLAVFVMWGLLEQGCHLNADNWYTGLKLLRYVQMASDLQFILVSDFLTSTSGTIFVTSCN